jgi:tRNA1(Val) A37 N6-methylase TrmN6
MTPATTADGFLGGRLTIHQPVAGYRAGTDPVLLAAAVPAVAGERVLELGTGVGTALLCLMARVPGLAATGVELQPEYADLARRNAADNGLPFDVVTADLTRLPVALKSQSFDHVLANPPFFDPARHTAARDSGRATAFSGATPLATWIDAALRRLAPGGRLTLIQRAERLPEVLAACDSRIGSLRILPLQGRAGRAAERVILHGRKGGRAGFRLLAPLTLHTGDSHAGDRESYTTKIRAVLRDAAALPVDWA